MKPLVTLGSEDYRFGRIKAAKVRAASLHPGVPLLDFGVGEPDQPADPSVVEVLAREAGRPENRRYADNGIVEFQEAASRYLAREFGVAVDPAQVVHGLGSKAILSLLPLCFIEPGDVALVPTPGYPVLGTHARFLGGEVFPLPLTSDNGFVPDLGAIPASVVNRAKVLYLNYPNNPTGAVAPPGFFARVVEFARSHGVFVVHDAAYATLTSRGTPESFLATPGAFDVGVEVHSLSKSHSMTGWRMGFVCGHPGVIAAYAAAKDHTDSGQFRAIQRAAAVALDDPSLPRRAAERYSRRLDLLVAALVAVGFDATKPGGTFYCYVGVPRGTRSGRRFATASEFCDFLIEAALVSTVPWDDAGAHVRFSATFEASDPADEVRVVELLRSRLESLELVFA